MVPSYSSIADCVRLVATKPKEIDCVANIFFVGSTPSLHLIDACFQLKLRSCNCTWATPQSAVYYAVCSSICITRHQARLFPFKRSPSPLERFTEPQGTTASRRKLSTLMI